MCVPSEIHLYDYVPSWMPATSCVAVFNASDLLRLKLDEGNPMWNVYAKGFSILFEASGPVRRVNMAKWEDICGFHLARAASWTTPQPRRIVVTISTRRNNSLYSWNCSAVEVRTIGVFSSISPNNFRHSGHVPIPGFVYLDRLAASLQYLALTLVQCGENPSPSGFSNVLTNWNRFAWPSHPDQFKEIIPERGVRSGTKTYICFYRVTVELVTWSVTARTEIMFRGFHES